MSATASHAAALHEQGYGFIMLSDMDDGMFSSDEIAYMVTVEDRSGPFVWYYDETRINWVKTRGDDLLLDPPADCTIVR